MVSGGAAGATAAVAGAAAVIAQAIKASGVIVRVDARDFVSILSRNKEPLVVVAQGRWPNRGYKYLPSYKGLAFFTKCKEPLQLPGVAELITARSIWIPG